MFRIRTSYVFEDEGESFFFTSSQKWDETIYPPTGSPDPETVVHIVEGHGWNSSNITHAQNAGDATWVLGYCGNFQATDGFFDGESTNNIFAGANKGNRMPFSRAMTTFSTGTNTFTVAGQPLTYTYRTTSVKNDTPTGFLMFNAYSGGSVLATFSNLTNPFITGRVNTYIDAVGQQFTAEGNGISIGGTYFFHSNEPSGNKGQWGLFLDGGDPFVSQRKGRPNFVYEANTVGGYPVLATYLQTMFTYTFDYIINRQRFDMVNGPAREMIYTVASEDVDYDNPGLIGGGEMKTYFQNEYQDEADGYVIEAMADYDGLFIGGACDQTLNGRPIGIGVTQGVDVDEHFTYLEPHPGYRGMAIGNGDMRIGTVLTEGNYGTFSSPNHWEYAFGAIAAFQRGFQTWIIPYSKAQDVFSLNAGAIQTLQKQFLNMKTQVGLGYYPITTYNMNVHQTDDRDDSLGRPINRASTFWEGEGKISYRNYNLIGMSYSQLYPQVFTYDSDVSSYNQVDYNDMEPWYAKYSYYVLYRESGRLDKAAKVNLFYGLYTIVNYDEEGSTLQEEICVTGCSTKEYFNADYDVLISQANIVDIKKAHRMFGPGFHFNYDPLPAFVKTFSVGVAEGQKTLVIPCKSKKWMPPENYFDVFFTDFSPLTVSNPAMTSLTVDTRLSALINPRTFVYDVGVSRAYSTVEPYYQ